ncbi:site-specific integrase [Planctomonas psychrotolerans]|uniref:hypothetical protein n=1 Tax=Planctomonas psychrotolerans TaxID=2528712 RepID=UPI00123C0667|nr:hypothetical protein [Planctomonas psychrotolerans]
MQYAPHLPEAHWAPIRDFVTGCVRDAVPPNVKWAQDALGFTARYVHWATTVAAIPLDRLDMFHPTVIHRFALTYTSVKSRQIAEARLHRIREALGEDAEARRVRVKVTDARPYNSTDLPGLFSWVATQRTPSTRRDGCALLGFCGGAGLRAVELVELRASDVITTDDGYLVQVSGKYPRQIPVRRGWEKPVEEALEGLDPDRLIAVPHIKAEGRLKALASFGRRAEGNAPRAARLRVTWITELVNVLPLGSLVHAAGYNSPASLVRYMGHADQVPLEEMYEALRGPVVTS